VVIAVDWASGTTSAADRSVGVDRLFLMFKTLKDRCDSFFGRLFSRRRRPAGEMLSRVVVDLSLALP
jgi:hypothetical protein